MFYGFVITEAGNSLLASMVAGQTLTITKAVVGEGTADNAEAARKLTNLIDPGPEGTSTVPTVEENSVNMIVEYRSDLNGGLQQGFWIGEFGIFGKVGTGAETLIGYGSLGDAKQYVSAYVSGTAPDVRRYPVSITVTTGIQVDVAYPAEAWMTAEDVADLFNQTLKPELEESLDGLIEDHNEDPDAHQGALKNKQDQIKVEGLLKGSKTTTEEGETYNVGAATPGTDYQAPTNTLTAAESMTTQDLIPFYDATAGQHKRTTLQALKEAIGVQSPTISVTTCTGASVTCSDGAETTLQGTGSTDFELPHVGTWTVTASLGGESVSEQVQVGGGLLYEVDLMITSGIAVTTQPAKTTYYIGEAFDPAGMVVTATFADDTTANVTEDCEFSPQTMAAGTQSVTVTYQRAGVQKTASVAVAVRVLDHIDVTTEPSKKAYKYGETFNPAGMVVTAYYTDDQSRAVTGYTYSPTGALDMDDTTITISYTEGSVTKQTTQAITVAKVLDSIEITTPPNKTAYFSGETFNPAGMVVTAHYTDGSSQAVSGYTYSPTGALVTGNTTITVSYSEGGVTKTDTQTITVTAISNTLNSNSWATIKAVSDAGQGDNYWDVGDTKAITINGNVGNTNFSNLSINVYIIGFNHNSAREGNNRIHFKIGKIGGTQVALVDSQYGSGVSSSGYFSMNTSNTNTGGWANSYHRRTLLGNTGTPTSPPSNSLLAAMPADLRAVMKAVTKYSDNTGGGNNTASYVTSTTDYLFELAEFEYHGARTYANSAEQNYQQQYAYYQAGNSKIHYKHNATGTAANVWCRSVYAGNTSNFCLVHTGGSASNNNAGSSWGVAPGFAA
ncbi:MAG: bacterial Ig-like domain-containing protein [Dysosmobacter sp.]|nr:bacterial Ig-like domain-containing protein [Dysosmobacter sp.]